MPWRPVRHPPLACASLVDQPPRATTSGGLLAPHRHVDVAVERVQQRNQANVGAGSDSVLVTRLDARSWQVQSQAAPDQQRAYCENNGALYSMPVSFVVVSSANLP